MSEAAVYAVAAAGSALSKSGPGLSDKDQTERLYAQIKGQAGVRRLS